MTRTEFLKAMLDKGNKAGAYTIDEARSAGECIESVELDLNAYKDIKDSEGKPKDPKK